MGLFLLFSLSYLICLHSQTKDPILRIETGAHNGIIRRIAVDAANKYLVTGAEDKTVRLWELSTGKPIRILRPPIGSGSEGSIDAVAISPDAKVILCGGYTGWEWEQQMCLYVFNRESGVIMKRLKGIPNVVHDIKFSGDGKYFGLASQRGIRLYRSSDYSLVGADEAYDGPSHCVSFYSSYFISVADDGYIRLYDLTSLPGKNQDIEKFSPASMKLAPSGHKPFSCAFSPDGSQIAVGYEDSKNVDILSGAGSSNPLEYVFSPDVSDLDSPNLGYTVAWSKDGGTLYAGGTYWNAAMDSRPIRKWSQGGRGQYTDIPLGISPVGQIVALNQHRIAAAELGTSFGVLDSNDNKVWYQHSFTADFRNNTDGFLTSYDGSSFQFAYQLRGVDRACFYIKTRNLEYPLGYAQTEALQPPITFSNAVRVTNWKSNHTPMLDSTQLILEDYEDSKCLAIAPDKESFILGTGYYVHAYDVRGNKRWTYSPQGPAWAVNISGNNKVAVAALDDGTIRWFRMWDGKELLSFFPHSDRKRWVLWTPSGYYDVSPGGEDLIGWHINNGRDSIADFFSVSKFRATYYRPDIIANVVELLDESEAVRAANKELGKTSQETSLLKVLPPVVSIVSPHDGDEISSAEVSVRYSVRSPSGESLTNIKALIDGRPVPTQRGAEFSKDISDENVIKILVPEHDCALSVIAENQFAASDPATVRLVWKGKQENEFTLKPKLYMLSIGVSRYHDEHLRLGLSSKDAGDFSQTMLKQKGNLYSNVIQKVLVDEDATKDSILDGLEWIQRETTSKDVAMIFLAGHGVDDATGNFYFLPVDADLSKLKRSGLPFTEFKNTISALAGKVILFIDACHSGNIMGERRGTMDINAVVNELTTAENGAVVFSSSTGKQYSLEDPKWNNGAFTKALIEGIEGGADFLKKGKITVNMLDAYIADRVKELTKGQQTPVTTKPPNVQDFPVAVK